ncbi:unnamed protein product [Musa textilis]
MLHDFWVLETSVLIILSTSHHSGVVFICTICFSQYSYFLVQYLGDIQVCHGLLWGFLCYYLLSCDNKVVPITLQCVMEFLFLITRTCWFTSLRTRSFKDFGDEYVLGWHESNIPYAVWGLSSTRSLSLKYYPSEVSHWICQSWTERFSLK